MKRVIEIDENMFYTLRNAEDMDCEVSAEAHIINKSKSLNAVLDKIKERVKKECNYNNLLRPFTLSDVFYAIEQAINEEENK